MLKLPSEVVLLKLVRTSAFYRFDFRLGSFSTDECPVPGESSDQMRAVAATHSGPERLNHTSIGSASFSA